MDKTKSKLYITNIKNIAVEKDFYRVDRKEDEFYWEHYYAENIEQIIFTTFKKLISVCTLSSDNSFVLDDKLKLNLAKIICSQLLRTKKAREEYFKIGKITTDSVIKKVEKEYKSLFNEEMISYLDSYDYNKKLNREISLPIINDENRLKKFINFLLQRCWVVFKNVNAKKGPIVTSDHPVIYYDILTKRTDWGKNGLGRSKTSIFFPINHKLIIGLYTKDMYYNEMSKYDNRMLVIDDIPFFMKLNRLQYEQCHRQVYFSFK